MSTNDFIDQVHESEQGSDISSLERKEHDLEDRVASLENQIRPLNEQVLGEKYARPVQPAPQTGRESAGGREFSIFDAVIIAAVLAVLLVLVFSFWLPH